MMLPFSLALQPLRNHINRRCTPSSAGERWSLTLSIDNIHLFTLVPRIGRCSLRFRRMGDLEKVAIGFFV
jgi:hypothetical protein